MSSFVEVYDVATPPGTEARSQGDDRIREFKRSVIERLLVEHDFPVASGAGSGRHKFSYGATGSRPTDVVAGSIFINTTTLTVDLWNGSSWVPIPGVNFLPLSGGNMTGALVMDNNVVIQGENTSGTARNLIYNANTNQIIVGDAAEQLVLVSSSNIATVVGGVLGILWNSQNDGSGSGLDADLVRGLAGDFTRSLAGNGYQKLPGGLIIQWGTTVVGAGATVLQALPIAFPNTFFCVVGSYQTTNGGNQRCATAIASGLSNVSLKNDEPSFANNISWIAVGN